MLGCDRRRAGQTRDVAVVRSVEVDRQRRCSIGVEQRGASVEADADRLAGAKPCSASDADGERLAAEPSVQTSVSEPIGSTISTGLARERPVLGVGVDRDVLGADAEDRVAAGRRGVASNRSRRAGSSSRRSTNTGSPAPFATRPSRKFMAGEPMKPATKQVDRACCRSSCGVVELLDDAALHDRDAVGQRHAPRSGRG